MMHSSICTSLQARPRVCLSDGTMMSASTAAAEDSCPLLLGKKHTAATREGDTSEGCARFLHVFVVCCVNTVGPVEVSI